MNERINPPTLGKTEATLDTIVAKAEIIGAYRELNRFIVWAAKMLPAREAKLAFEYMSARRDELNSEAVITLGGKL